MIVCHLPRGPFAKRRRSFSVSNTINIIIFSDVSHDWWGRGGGGDVEGLMGRMGVGGGDGVIQLHVRDST